MSGTLNGAPGAQGYLVSDLVGLALRQIGTGAMGTSPGPGDISDGVMHLNMMLAQWQRRRWLVPNLIDKAFLSTGAAIYQIGPGGALDTPVRPSQVKAAYARLLNGASVSTDGEFDTPDFIPGQFDTDTSGVGAGGYPIDYSLAPIPSYEDYAAISLKGMQTWPRYFHYNPAYPAGEFRPWPIPPAAIWEFHILYAEPLPTNLGPSDAINLPPEYWDAIMWLLAARLAPSYGQEASATVTAMARAALATIRTANQQTPILGMPAALTPSGGGFWWPGLEVQRL